MRIRAARRVWLDGAPQVANAPEFTKNRDLALPRKLVDRDAVTFLAQCEAGYIHESDFMRRYRTALFTRIVPAMKDIGLWGDKTPGTAATVAQKIRAAYGHGYPWFADADLAELGRSDERVVDEFEAQRAAVDDVARIREFPKPLRAMGW